MAKSLKPGAQRPDWAALRKAFDAIDTQQSMDELAPAYLRGEIVEPRWAPEYLPALQQWMELRNPEPLIELLASGRLIHPLLLPGLAEVLRAKQTGFVSGAPRKLTEVQEQTIRFMAAQLVGPEKMGATAFDESLADALSVSSDTIKRARLLKPVQNR